MNARRHATDTCLVPAAVLLLLAAPAWGSRAGAQSPQAPHDATAHHPFTDVEKWKRIFDDPKRDEWQKPKQVVEALGLSPGSIVADLGAGTGYFERYLSKAVSPGGIVLAIDTEPAMVRQLAERALKEGTANVVPVLALPQEPFLPPGRVDRVLIADTYHHVDDRIRYFRRLGDLLAPGGRVAIVDFHKRPLPVGPPPEHKLSREFVLDEMKQAGYRLSDEKTFLPYHYFLIFERGAPAC
jgi:ubiquinone/menaquinone biosynthesis C-methylase UbiE